MVLSDENNPERNRAAEFRSTLIEGKTYHRKIYVRKYDRFAEDALIVHHIVRLLDGGTSDDGNLTNLCNECHNKKHAEMRVNPQLPLFRKRRIIGYRKGAIYTETPKGKK